MPGKKKIVRFIAPTMVSNHRVELHTLKQSVSGEGPIDTGSLDIKIVGQGMGGVVFPGMVERGEADTGYSGLSIVIREADLNFISALLTGPVGLQRGDLPEGSHQVLLVRNDSHVQSMDDLQGGVIGVNGVKPVTICALKILLSKVMGYELSYEFEFRVNPDYEALIGMLDSGRVNAILTYENYTAVLESVGSYRPVFDIAVEWRKAFGHDLVSTVGFAATGFVQENPDVCREFSNVVAESIDYADKHLEETCSVIASRALVTGESRFTDAGLIADVYRRWDHKQLDDNIKGNILDYLGGCYELGLLNEEPREQQLFC